MPLLALTLTQETILNEIREFNEPITLEELVALGSLKKATVLYALVKLVKKRVVFKKRKTKKGNTYYYYTKHKGIDASSKKSPPPTKIKPIIDYSKNTPQSVSEKQPVYTEPMSPKKSVSKKKIDIQQRCYHLLMAGRSKSSGEVSDFFNISEDQGVRLLRGLAKKYPNEIKIDIMARVI